MSFFLGLTMAYALLTRSCDCEEFGIDLVCILAPFSSVVLLSCLGGALTSHNVVLTSRYSHKANEMIARFCNAASIIVFEGAGV